MATSSSSSSSESTRKRYELVVFGGSSVGKSCLTMRLVDDKYEEMHDPTIMDNYQTEKMIDGERCVLNVLDTVGTVFPSEMFARNMIAKETRGFLLVYSITSRESFDAMDEYLDAICEHSAFEMQDLAILVAGNKCDLEEYRKVTKKEGQMKAEEWKAKKSILTGFLECSAKQKINNKEVFYELVRLVNQVSTKLSDDSSSSLSEGCTCVII